jgi:hypothetical protein
MSAKTAKPGWLTRLSVFELALAVLFDRTTQRFEITEL